MRVYYHGERRNQTLFVAPAADPRQPATDIASDWVGDDGKPVTFVVDFRDGAAEVSDSLGRYLCATGQAKRTRLWMPRSFLGAAA